MGLGPGRRRAWGESLLSPEALAVASDFKHGTLGNLMAAATRDGRKMNELGAQGRWAPL